MATLFDKKKTPPEPVTAPVHKPAANSLPAVYADLGFSVDDNMEGVEARLPQIGIVHQAQVFKMPDGSTTNEIVGIVVDSNRTNAYWAESIDKAGAGNPPDCFSFDSLVPAGEQPRSATCHDCKYNAFGSEVAKNGESGRGKACKNTRRVHILIGGNTIPYRLPMPPSSLRAWDDYMVTLASKSLPYQAVLTKVTLAKAKNKNGIEFSRCVFETADTISDVAVLREIGQLRLKFRNTMRQQAITVDETDAGETGPDPF